MLLRSLEIRGWRSIPPDPAVVLSDLGPVNLLIGPNNSGKSNIGRLLLRLAEVAAKATDFPRVPKEKMFDPQNAAVQAACMAFDDPDPGDLWLAEDSGRTSVLLEWVPCRADEAGAILVDGVARLLYGQHLEAGRWYPRLLPLDGEGRPFFRQQRASYELEHLLPDLQYGAGRADQLELFERTRAHGHLLLELAQSILYVEALRQIGDEKPRPLATSYGGNTLLSDLQRLADHEPYQFSRLKHRLQRWLQDLLGETHPVRVEVRTTGIRLEFEREKRPLPVAVADLGTGVTEMVMVLAGLLLHPDRPRVVFIEEPEAHLHPGAVVAFVNLLRAEFPKAQLFITSHSTSLIDAITPDWRVFRFSNDGSGTVVKDLSTRADQLGLLADLRVQPSQLFLARSTIWVEGPSDVLYYRRLLASSGLVERRDYGFIIYGGACGRFLGVDAEPTSALVDLLSVSTNPVVLCDRDDENASRTAWLNTLRSAVAKAVGEDHVLTTPGIEVEDLVAPEVMLRAATALVTRAKDDNEQIRRVHFRLVPRGEEAFNVWLAGCARWDGLDGPALSEVEAAKLAIRIDGLKADLAFKVAAEEANPFTQVASAFKTAILNLIGP